MQIYIKYLDITKKYIQQKTKTDYIELKHRRKKYIYMKARCSQVVINYLSIVAYYGKLKSGLQNWLLDSTVDLMTLNIWIVGVRIN